MKEEIPHLQGTHCFLQRHALASNTLPSKLTKLADISVKTINWIKGCALNQRLSNFMKILEMNIHFYVITQTSSGSYVGGFQRAS